MYNVVPFFIISEHLLRSLDPCFTPWNHITLHITLDDHNFPHIKSIDNIFSTKHYINSKINTLHYYTEIKEIVLHIFLFYNKNINS